MQHDHSQARDQANDAVRRAVGAVVRQQGGTTPTEHMNEIDHTLDTNAREYAEGRNDRPSLDPQATEWQERNPDPDVDDNNPWIW
jgi:hypothetical protein